MKRLGFSAIGSGGSGVRQMRHLPQPHCFEMPWASYLNLKLGLWTLSLKFGFRFHSP